jgi:transposase
MMLEDSKMLEQGTTVLDPAPKPKRRTYTAEYRARILAEYEAAPHGEKSAVLRREGLYQTLVAQWAKARDATAAGTTYRRERKPRSKQSQTASEAVKLEAENARLTKQLEQTQAALDVMGKVHGLLELLSERSTSSPAQTGQK